MDEWQRGREHDHHETPQGHPGEPGRCSGAGARCRTVAACPCLSQPRHGTGSFRHRSSRYGNCAHSLLTLGETCRQDSHHGQHRLLARSRPARSLGSPRYVLLPAGISTRKSSFESRQARLDSLSAPPNMLGNLTRASTNPVFSAQGNSKEQDVTGKQDLASHALHFIVGYWQSTLGPRTSLSRRHSKSI